MILLALSDWLVGPIQQVLYMFLTICATIIWYIERAGFYIVDMINHFREGLVTAGFTSALDSVSTEVIGISRPAFELALVVGLLCIIVLPIVPLRWVSMRKAIFLAFVLPIGLPILAGGFQDIEEARGSLATSLYTSVYDGAKFDIIPADSSENGMSNDMDKPDPLFSKDGNDSGSNSMDVAGAYLYANRDDIVKPGDSRLPVKFKDTYFSLDVSQLDGTTDGWDAVNTATKGIARLIFGIILIAVAFVEALINLCFTLTLGILLIAFIISLLFAYFSIFESMPITIIRKFADLFLQSWAISCIQALVLAALVSVADKQNPIATLGMSLLVLWVELLFLSAVKNTFIQALSGMGTGNTGSAAEANNFPQYMKEYGTAGKNIATTAGGAVSAAARRMPFAATATRMVSNVGGMAKEIGAIPHAASMAMADGIRENFIEKRKAASPANPNPPEQQQPQAREGRGSTGYRIVSNKRPTEGDDSLHGKETTPNLAAQPTQNAPHNTEEPAITPIPVQNPTSTPQQDALRGSEMPAITPITAQNPTSTPQQDALRGSETPTITPIAAQNPTSTPQQDAPRGHETPIAAQNLTSTPQQDALRGTETPIAAQNPTSTPQQDAPRGHETPTMMPIAAQNPTNTPQQDALRGTETPIAAQNLTSTPQQDAPRGHETPTMMPITAQNPTNTPQQDAPRGHEAPTMMPIAAQNPTSTPQQNAPRGHETPIAAQNLTSTPQQDALRGTETPIAAQNPTSTPQQDAPRGHETPTMMPITAQNPTNTPQQDAPRGPETPKYTPTMAHSDPSFSERKGRRGKK